MRRRGLWLAMAAACALAAQTDSLEFRAPRLIYQVNADYPKWAAAARLWGPLGMEAVIGKGGEVDELKYVAGHPVLIKPAFEAAKQFRFRPATRNGRPVQGTTPIWIDFPSGRTLFPAAVSETERTRTGPFDARRFAGAWKGTLRARDYPSVRLASTVRWDISIQARTLTKSQRGSGLTDSFPLDGTEHREGEVRRRITTLTRNLIEVETLTPRQPIGVQSPEWGPPSCELSTESWQLDPPGRRMTVVMSFLFIPASENRRYLIYEFERDL